MQLNIIGIIGSAHVGILTVINNNSLTDGWFAGGYTVPGMSIIDKINYATDTMTALAKGGLSVGRSYLAGCNNGTYGWFGGGLAGAAAKSYIDRITFANDTATAESRCRLNANIYALTVVSSIEYGWFGSGSIATSGTYVTYISRLIFSLDTVNTAVRTVLPYGSYASAGVSDVLTSGWFAGGYNGIVKSTISKLIYATDTIAASSMGLLAVTRNGMAGTGNTTDGWFAGGDGPGLHSTIERLIYASDTVTATLRGKLTIARNNLGGNGNSTDGWFGGGASKSTVDRLIYATDTINTTLRGPLSLSRSGLSGI